MEVEVKSWPSLLKEEVLNPFYIFQLGSVILWCLDDYTYYASCVLVISALSIGIALVETRRQAEMVRRMAATSEVGSVRVRMRGHEGGVLVSSKDLVPGDVLLIPREGCVLPCDAVLTGGSCLVNEGLLTGESTPVQVQYFGGDEIFQIFGGCGPQFEYITKILLAFLYFSTFRDFQLG